MIYDEALKYATRREFRHNSPRYCDVAGSRGILDEVCSHMSKYQNNRVWTDEKVKEEALKYNTRGSFKKGSPTAYIRAIKEKLLDDVCLHMEPKPHVLTRAEMVTIAQQYKHKSVFNRYDEKAYRLAHRLGILDEICSHMIPMHKSWNNEGDIRKEALKYHDRKTFQLKSRQAYRRAAAKGILSDICSHMSYTRGGFQNTKPALLYYLSIDNGLVYKIGITNLSVAKRFSKEEMSRIKIINIEHFEIGDDAYKREQHILKEFKYAKYKGKTLLTDGNSELFDRDVLGLDL